MADLEGMLLDGVSTGTKGLMRAQNATLLPVNHLKLIAGKTRRGAIVESRQTREE